jgi:4-diphosphocytidyl-2-C-methyl-D-erythritol kinase
MPRSHIPSSATLTLPSYAKINLFLRILRRDRTGYHQIETVFQTVSLHDVVRFTRTRRPGIRLRGGPPAKENIVYRAAARLAPPDSGVRIELDKRIPTGAGLGGGSSNAAVTLLAVNHLFGLGYSLAELARVGAELGSDVPFFLAGGTALGLNHGEKVFPLPDAPGSKLILLYPGVPVYTTEAYAKLQLTKGDPGYTIHDFCYALVNHRVEALEQFFRNDFERTVASNSAVAEARQFLEHKGLAKAHLSGSGSTLFWLGSHSGRIRVRKDWRLWQAEFITRGQYMKSLGRCLE